MRLEWITPEAQTILSRKYLRENETIEDRYNSIFETAQKYYDKPGFSDRLRSYVERNWVSFATPVLRNFGASDNLSISCNKGTLTDSLDSILKGLHEVGMQAKYGAGVSMNFSDIRPIGSTISAGGTSEGIMPFIKLYEELIRKVSQNANRRGAMAAYLSVEHPEIMDFLDIGADGNEVMTILPAVTVPEGWIQSLLDGDKHKRKIWSKIMKMRFEKQKPYLLFLDNCNDQKPQWYKDKGLRIETSNLCNEIISFVSEEKSFACCLSSVILTYYDQWKSDKNFISDIVALLNCVLNEYIDQASTLPGLEKAVRHAREHRSIGLGAMGLHTYLQQNSIPFGSLKAMGLNNEIFKHIKEKADKATIKLKDHFGEPEFFPGLGRANDLVIAIAPTKSTSTIHGGHSLGIEPYKSNYHVKELSGTSFTFKNPTLMKLLQERDKDTPETWMRILKNNGSVKNLDFLTDHEKEVFKCFYEISQMDIVNAACIRQKHIDQGQSLNLMFTPKTPIKDINKVVIEFWKNGGKGLYYQYNMNASQQSDISCSSCEG